MGGRFQVCFAVLIYGEDMTDDPKQVFSCWNGIAVFTAKPLMEGKIKFRSVPGAECFLGEPTLLCMDLWKEGYGKVGIVLSVNVGYEDNSDVKDLRGTMERWVERGNDGTDLIEWGGRGAEENQV